MKTCMASYIKEVPVWQIGEQVTEDDDFVVTEHQIKVMFDWIPAFQLVCSPDQRKELVIGHLLTQGYIQNITQLSRMDMKTVGETTHVNLHGTFTRSGEEIITTTGTVTRSGGDLPGPVTPGLKWKKEWIFQLAELFKKGTEAYDRTHGVHSCMLARGGECLFRSEDIGRHNALDKVVGRALLENVDLSQSILYSSGRIPADMMRKVIRSKVPIIVSNSVPTDEAICLAKQYGITLIGKARPSGMILYTIPEPSFIP